MPHLNFDEETPASSIPLAEACLNHTEHRWFVHSVISPIRAGALLVNDEI